MRVAKIGGSYLDSPQRYAHAARLLTEGPPRPQAVVVSAMAGVTDGILATAFVDGLSARDMDELLAWGEVESARAMHAALQGAGIDSHLLLPDDPAWPILTDSKHGDASPRGETFDRLRAALEPLLAKAVTPVLPGFVGKDGKGRLTTMGRGGSDLTAVLVARALAAQELVVVKGSRGRPLPWNAPVNGDFLQAKAVAELPAGLSVRFVYPERADG
ncbi:MAG TPA: hypothetical protein VM681_00685 [Candidatus Thermoplasmatota archaeon]|nr:hypothetical protein [Candidatus Thermoplasmatota archaeon]